MQQTKVVIPLDPVTGFFTSPYTKEIADHNITKEEFQNTLFTTSHKLQNSGSGSKCCGIVLLLTTLCCCTCVGLVYFGTFLIMSGSPAMVKSSVRGVLSNKMTHTVAYGGDEMLKVRYLRDVAEQLSISMTFLTNKPTNTEILNAFKSKAVYVNVEKLGEENKATFCEAASSSSATLFAGYEEDSRIVSKLLNGCRKGILGIYYFETVPSSSWTSLFIWFIGTFACIFGCPIMCFACVKFSDKKKLRKIETEVAMESTMKYSHRGVQFVFTATRPPTLEMHLFSQIPSPSYIQVQPNFQVPQQVPIPMQNVPLGQPQFRPVTQTTQVPSMYYTSTEVVESPNQPFLYPKQQGIINDSNPNHFSLE
jgi:hypothetical protein